MQSHLITHLWQPSINKSYYHGSKQPHCIATAEKCSTRGIYPPQSQETPQNVCERIAIPRRKRKEHLQHSGLWRYNTFMRLRVRRCFAVPRVVGGVNGENAAERKETDNFTRWHGCTYRQFTRGSTLTA